MMKTAVDDVLFCSLVKNHKSLVTVILILTVENEAGMGSRLHQMYIQHSVFLNKHGTYLIPTFLVPSYLKNKTLSHIFK
jgi:hypothetical protein